MDRINVLLTTCGALTSPSLISAIKDNGEREIKVIGIDTFSDVAGAYLADRFHQVPSSDIDEELYVKTVLDIVSTEEISVILPCGHEDCLAISKNQTKFESMGAKVAISPYDTLVRGFDKGLAYATLQKAGAGGPEFYIASNHAEFLSASTKLGYPGRPIVLKPKLNRGGRGVMVLNPEGDFNGMLQAKADINYSFEYISDLIENQGKFPPVIVMEYLPGETYSVDMLTSDGESLVTVPKIRQWGDSSQTFRGLVDLNENVINVAEMACKALNFSYNVNLEIKLDSHGIPVVYDPNPRLAASTAFCKAAGANLVYLAIKLALGEPFSLPKVQDRVMMIRYFAEMFLEDGQI